MILRWSRRNGRVLGCRGRERDLDIGNEMILWGKKICLKYFLPQITQIIVSALLQTAKILSLSMSQYLWTLLCFILYIHIYTYKISLVGGVTLSSTHTCSTQTPHAPTGSSLFYSFLVHSNLCLMLWNIQFDTDGSNCNKCPLLTVGMSRSILPFGTESSFWSAKVETHTSCDHS